MATFWTMNPIGSTSPKDLSDNAENLDYLMLGPLSEYEDRRRVPRLSWKGIELAFKAAQDQRESSFQSFLEGTGWSSLGVYAAGISIVSHTQTVDYLGQPYQLKPSIPASLTSPYVTTGNWATEGSNFKLVGDNSLRQDLNQTLYARFIFSKIKADGNAAGTTGTDDTAQLQLELNQLKAGDYYITPPGYSLITHVICPTLSDVTFRFNGTKFVLKAGHDPLDNEMFRWNSLRNSDVFNFYTDGNVANVPDAPVGSDVRYGRVLNWRLGNNSENVRFYNLTMVNASYNGSQWGNNIRNIQLIGITYDNIGEHVFYVSGTGGGNVKGITWAHIKGGSFGVNVRNAVGNHECAFVKSFQTVGANDDWYIDDLECVQAVAAGFACVVLTSQDLSKARLSNIRLGDNMTALLYPTAGTGKITIDGVSKLGSGTQPRLIYSHVAAATIGKLVGKNMDFTNTFTIDHIQLFDLLEDCTFSRIDTSLTNANDFGGRERTVILNRCKFMKIGYLRYVEHHFQFNDCEYLSAETGSNGSLESIGNLAYTDGRWVAFSRPRFAGAHQYCLSTQNALARVRIENAIGPMKPVFGRASTPLAKLILDTIETPNGSNPVAGLTVGSRKLSRVISVDGLRDWANYSNTWTVATGQTFIGFDLNGVVAAPFTMNDVTITPIGHFVPWNASLTGTTLTVTVNAVAAVPLLFAVTVKL